MRKSWLDAGLYFESDKGDGKGDGGNGDGTGKKPDKETPPEPKFTQADLDRILGERVSRAEETTQKKLLEALGVKDADEAKKILDDAKKLREQQMSDLEKAKADADEAKVKADKAEADRKVTEAKATERLMRAAVLSECTKAEYKLREDARADVWTFIDKALIKPKGEDDFEGIAEAVKAVIKAKPYLVEAAAPGHGTPKPGTKKQPNKTGEKRPIKTF